MEGIVMRKPKLGICVLWAMSVGLTGCFKDCNVASVKMGEGIVVTEVSTGEHMECACEAVVSEQNYDNTDFLCSIYDKDGCPANFDLLSSSEPLILYATNSSSFEDYHFTSEETATLRTCASLEDSGDTATGQ